MPPPRAGNPRDAAKVSLRARAGFGPRRPVDSRLLTDCLFDRIVDGRQQAHLVVDEADVVAFLDHRPLFPGHTLVIPRRHLSTLAEVPVELLGELFTTARRIATAFRPALDAQGAFLAVNDEVSQSVPHVHVHVIPRRYKDGLRGFFWPRQRYDDDDHAAQVAAALRAALEAEARE